MLVRPILVKVESGRRSLTDSNVIGCVGRPEALVWDFKVIPNSPESGESHGSLCFVVRCVVVELCQKLKLGNFGMVRSKQIWV